MTAKLKSPHILLAAGNCMRMRSNIAHLLTRKSLASVDQEIARNVVSLFRLGNEHFTFAVVLQPADWRQKVSRYYYGTYNAQRAVRLRFDGSFATDSTDHKEIGRLPNGFPNAARYTNQLSVLRDDRNLADYSHEATVGDLVIPLADAEQLARDFIEDARQYLLGLGVAV